MSNYRRRGKEFTFYKCDYTEEEFEFADLAQYGHYCHCQTVETTSVMCVCSCRCHNDLNPRGRYG